MAQTPQGKKAGLGRLGDAQAVTNQGRKFGAATIYYAVRFQLPSGVETTGLFTQSQISIALARAKKNPEDVPTARGVLDFITDALD